LTQHWLVYDNDCGFCTQRMAWIRGRGCPFTLVPRAEADPLLARLGIDPARCANSILYIKEEADGSHQVQMGARAVNSILASLPGGKNAPFRLLSGLYHWPAMPLIQETMYGWVARNRHWLGGSTNCVLPLKDPE
jgi:predicted DCC family thiol-disulfide oxidoreductase YuxK